MGACHAPDDSVGKSKFCVSNSIAFQHDCEPYQFHNERKTSLQSALRYDTRNFGRRNPKNISVQVAFP